MHHQYNPQIAQHNLVYQNQYQQQQFNAHGYGYNYNGQQGYRIQGQPHVNQSNGLWF